MATNNNDIINNIKNKTINSILIYGKSNSSINRQLENFITFFNTNNYTIDNINYELLKTNENLLIDNFQSFSMFEEHILFVLRLRERPNDYTSYIKSLLEVNDLNTDNFLIVVAGDLIPESSLKKLYSNNSKTDSVVCYEEENTSISTLIKSKLKENHFSFTDEIIAYLTSNIGKNSMYVNNELEKIILYKGNDKNLTLEDVEKCTKNLNEFDLGDLVNSFCSFREKETFQALQNAKTEGVANIVIIRTLIKYFLQLQKMSYKIKNGKTIDEVIKEERIFWKQIAFTKQHLAKWSFDKNCLMLEKLIELEKSAKFGNNIAEIEIFFVKCFLKFKK